MKHGIRTEEYLLEQYFYWGRTDGYRVVSETSLRLERSYWKFFLTYGT